MAIDTGKILNISIDEYCINQFKRSGSIAIRHSHNYTLIGVHCDKESIKAFASLVPDEAEVVVKYEKQFFGAGAAGITFKYHQIGVALIPKSK